MTSSYTKIFYCLTLLLCISKTFDVHTTQFFNHKNTSLSLTPATLTELEQIVRHASKEGKKISLVGSGKSQGGQTYCSDQAYVQISLANLNKLIALDHNKKEVTVQAGMTWKQLIRHLAPHRFAVRAMQSYSDFSIGGSLGVNAHGRDFTAAPLIKTVQSIKIILHDGSLITASRTENENLFRLAVGGYGLFGIIVEATLSITDDCILTRKTVSIAASELGNYFQSQIQSNPEAQLYSARFSVGTKDLLEKALIIWYEKTNLTSSRLFKVKRHHGFRNFLSKQSLYLTQKFPKLKNMRYEFEHYLFSSPETISRNNFMDEHLDGLLKDTWHTHYILQEYFIRYENLPEFITYLRSIISSWDINILNVTARHINQDRESYLSFAPEECCSLVLYIALKNKEKPQIDALTWTRQLIDKALALKGSYYLPYHLLASHEQLVKAYPNLVGVMNHKLKYDPTELFSNMFYEHYKCQTSETRALELFHQ